MAFQPLYQRANLEGSSVMVMTLKYIPGFLSPCLGGQNYIPGFCFGPALAAVVAGMWGVKQHMGNSVSLCLSRFLWFSNEEKLN